MLRPVPKPKKSDRKKPKKPPSKAQLRVMEKQKKKSLIKELTHLYSVASRKEWGGKCAMCGKAGSAAHHFFGKKACSALRFTLDNLVWLCFACHIRKVHQEGLVEPARIALIKKIGEERFEELYATAFRRMDWGVEELLEVRSRILG